MLLRDLAEAGAAVLLYTSELKEIQLVCDRAIVIFGGRVVAEIAAEDADEPTLLRAAYDLPPDAVMPEEVAASRVAAEASRGRGRIRPATPEPPAATRAPARRRTGMTAATATAAPRRTAPPSPRRAERWTLGLLGFLVVLLAFTKLIQPELRGRRPPGLAIAVLPLALAAVGQAIVVISGGIDLSVAAMMALTSVIAAS